MKLAALLGVPVLAAGLAVMPAPAQAGTDVGIRIEVGHRGDYYQGYYRRDGRHRCRESRDRGYCRHRRGWERWRQYDRDDRYERRDSYRRDCDRDRDYRRY